MPFILIHLEEGKTEEQKQAVCRVVTADLSRNFRIPEQAVRILFQEYSPSQVSYRGLLKSSPEYRADKDGMLAANPHAQLVMPLVILYTEVGKSEEQFRLAAKDITTTVRPI